MTLTDHSYGKAHVGVVKVSRAGAQHSLKELDVQVMLHGKFESSYAGGDNRLVVATDTMKNTVNVFAKEMLGSENEEFGTALAEHFLKTYAQPKWIAWKCGSRNIAGSAWSLPVSRIRTVFWNAGQHGPPRASSARAKEPRWNLALRIC